MEWDWSTVQAWGGSVEDIPRTLGALLSGDESARDSAFNMLYSQVASSGDLVSAAAPVVDHILGDLARRRSLSAEAWLLLNVIFSGGSYGRRVTVDGADVELEEYCRGRIIESLPLIGAVTPGLQDKQFEYLMILLSKVGEFSVDVIPIIEREVAASSGERLTHAEDALEVALEMAAEAGLLD
ncbi:hypothetical protein Skr01_71910 [Sphaerisporangium krabiense]|uniref:Uncharacterized protein n=1 Tax=Sphaerisporangium krabiense TaxID=763782 RepID=A0A7W9DS99_9ACTN|nr:hypothetical protein [Sphaerisporangium krabiense]MBB5629331.1 hypothetical protein [Sphaerisporangium krabiense]GII67106.1 hypothetical protein Skr01_71910 [Sphaerisporangium krabiense]